MKINFQKFVAVIVACSVALVTCCLTVYAESSLHKDFITKTGGIVYNVWTGRMTPEEASVELEYLNLVYESQLPDSDIEQIKSILPYITNGLAQSDVGMLIAIRDTLDLLGLDISGYWDDYSNENGIQGISNVDMKGYGAICILQNAVDTRIYYGDYGVITYFDNYGGYNSYMMYGNGFYEFYNTSNGILYKTESFTDSSFCGFDLDDTVKIYGDWRTNDGEAYDGVDEITTSPPVFEEQDEETIREFITEFMEQLPYMYPDLSTIEGLLQSIYNMLGTLDSDDDNILLSQILVAIQSLEASGGDNTEILNCLEEIKNSLVFENGDNITSLAVQLQTLVDSQLTADDFVIDEQAYINNYEVLKLRLQEKFSFMIDLKNLIDTAVTSYSNTNENPVITFSVYENEYSIDFSFFNEHIDVIRFMLVAFTYLTYAWHTYRKIPSYINGGDNE